MSAPLESAESPGAAPTFSVQLFQAIRRPNGLMMVPRKVYVGDTFLEVSLQALHRRGVPILETGDEVAARLIAHKGQDLAQKSIPGICCYLRQRRGESATKTRFPSVIRRINL